MKTRRYTLDQAAFEAISERIQQEFAPTDNLHHILFTLEQALLHNATHIEIVKE